jgi:hypothetical protein
MGLVTYGWADGVAAIALDDGKVNLMSPVVIAEIHAALDRPSPTGPRTPCRRAMPEASTRSPEWEPGS